ncbi:MAG: alpha-2-macroglobulin family protein [Akkermansiaceae bacterium]|nr:alpha-2-macroglobulin family protein [Akkermansiaceae bacterium]
MRILAILLLTCGAVFAADATEMRKQARKLEKDGNWKEAYELRVKLLRQVDDEKSGVDLTHAVHAQRRLSKIQWFDELMAELTEKKKDNYHFMSAAGDHYLSAQSYGSIKDNEFVRGENHGGQWMQVYDQDRLRALQCYLQAWKVAEKGGEEEVQVLRRIGDALTFHRRGGSMWELYLKTDLSKAPDYLVMKDTITTTGAPVGEDGQPDWIDVPVSWEAAKSDGERWRWTMKEIGRISESDGRIEEMDWWSFCKEHYGVETMASYGWWSQAGVEERDGLLKASTLEEGETIAKLANGVQRFELREDYQYIAGLRKLMRSGKSHPAAQAGDELVQVFLHRNQFVKAAETLEELIGLHGQGGEGSRGQLLDQIRGNWSRFGPTPTYHAGDKIEVPYVFRNAESTKLSIHKVDERGIMQDVMEYLESNPVEIESDRAHFQQLARTLIEGHGKKYVGEEVRAWEKDLEPAQGHEDKHITLGLGKLEPGCYLLKSELKDGNTSWIVVWVRDLVILSRTEDNKEVFYLVDSEAGAPVQGELEFFTYQVDHLKKRQGKRRFNVITHHFREKTDENGRLELPEKKKLSRHNWHIIGHVGQRTAHMTNHHMNWRSSGRDYDQHINHKTMGITDRPVYRPGQRVHVKLWAGEASYDLGEVSPYAGKTANIEVKDARNETIKKLGGLEADAYGGIEFDFELGEEAALGNYHIQVTGQVPGSHVRFRVEEYKKPEFEVKVEAPDEPVTLGEDFDVTVKANYYHGAPVTEATVKIKVERNFFNDRWFPPAPWDWLYGKGYWWCHESYPWYPGWGNWGCVRPSPPWWNHQRMGAPELVLEQTLPIGADGSVKVNVDSAIAKQVHGDQDHRYSITAEVVDASRRTIVGSGSVLAAREPYDVTVWLDRGYARVGDQVTGTFAARTLDGRKVEGEAKAILYATSVNDRGAIAEKKVAEWEPEKGSWVFVASKPGQYRMAVEFVDTKGRKREGATVFSVVGEDAEGDFRYNALELIPDKQEYRPGDVVKLLVNVNKPGSRVWLYIRSNMGDAESRRIITIDGKSQVIEVPVALKDMPNFFINAVSVADGQIHEVTREIVLPPEKRQLGVEVIPAKDKLKPREKTSLTIRITDHEGNPYQGSAAISIYDKSLEYISGGSNVEEIVPFFWSWKRHHHGLLMTHSQTLTGDHQQKSNTRHMQPLGLGPLHPRLGLNTWGGGGGMMEYAYLASMGDAVALESGAPNAFAARKAPSAGMAKSLSADMKMEAGDAQGQRADGAAAEVPELMVRSEFADLLKWVGSIETDEKGEATIELEMPDNLTTWKIKTWAMGKGTRVGEGSAEIVTSKDLIIRLQAPRFFVQKDEATLSAVVHNYHLEAKEVTVSLELEGKGLTSDDKRVRTVNIPSQGETRIDWASKAVAEGEVTIRMKALAADDSDAMEMDFPVYVHGITKTESYSRSIEPDENAAVIDFTLPKQMRPAESRLTINYSPSVASAMVDALPYLASYPHGCTEQTLNRFVPTVVVHHILTDMGYDLGAIRDKRSQLDPQKIGDAQERAMDWQRRGHREWNPVWDEKEVAKMERAGIARLREQQNNDGGWGWFSAYGEHSYPHTTAVVLHGLILARDNGSKIPKDMIERGLQWLEKHEAEETDKLEHWGKRKRNTKKQASAMDALVRRVLGEGGKDNQAMQGFLFRDKVDLPVYAKCLLGLELHRTGRMDERDQVIRNVRQFLVRDEENQTAYLELGNGGYWWNWYGSEYEAHAWFLKLLAAAEPKSPDASGLVKYLINNRGHGTYWNSTRDTAYCVEAIADYLKASGEGKPDMTVEVVLDGEVLKTVEINEDKLFTFDSSAVVAGDILTSGKHRVELRKKGKGPLYSNVYVEYFTLEDFITKAGLEVKVDRTYYKLVPDNTVIDAVDSEGQAIDQKRSRLKRVPLNSGDVVKSGELIEVELGIDSKNDYEYLIFEDWKAAGMEPVEVRSGYNPNGLGAYMELRDEKVCLFVQRLPRGRHNLSYRLRAEIPGKFSALPTQAEAMYAPELKANSDEMKIEITD